MQSIEEEKITPYDSYKKVKVVFSNWNTFETIPMQAFLAVGLFEASYRHYTEKSLLVSSFKYIDENTIIYIVDNKLYEDISKPTIMMFLEMLCNGIFRYNYSLCSSDNKPKLIEQMKVLIQNFGGIDENIILHQHFDAV
jgi:hypothetical protein